MPELPTEISSRCVSPTSPIHRRLVFGSMKNRQGLRKPQAKTRRSGAAVSQSAPVLSHAVTMSSDARGLSFGTEPSRFTRRILPLPLLRQLEYLLVGGSAFAPVSPTPT